MANSLKTFRSRWFERRAKDAYFSVPILCFHSWTIYGDSYETDDHVALEGDLALQAQRGYQILPLTELVAVLRGNDSRKKNIPKKLVCLTCDDGMDYDYHDYLSKEFAAFPAILFLLPLWSRLRIFAR